MLWVGSEESYYTAVNSYEKMADANESHRKELFDHDKKDEEIQEHYLLEIVGNVAVVTVQGSLVFGSEGSWGAYWGVIGYDDIRNAVITAVDQGVDEILFDYDSPGGSVKGIMELSDFIKSLGVKTTSFTGGVAASGGLWLATASDQFYASRMAEIGSLGVIAVTSEITEMYKEMGIALKVFKSTPLKAAGNPYEKLTKEAEEQIQKNIDETHQFFIREVADNRGLTEDYVAENIANGKLWFAAEAHELHLIDGVKSFDDVFLALRKESTDNANNFQHVEASDMATKKKIIDSKAAAAIASGVPVEKAVEDIESDEDQGTEASTDDAEGSEANTSDESTEASTDDADEETDAGGEGTEESTDGEEKDAAAAVLLKQVSALQDTTVNLKVQLRESEAKATSLEANQEGLVKVVAAKIQFAYVAIGSTAPDLKGLLAMDVSALLKQHASVEAQVAARYPVGGQVTSTVEETEDEDLAAAAKQINDVQLRQARIK